MRLLRARVNYSAEEAEEHNAKILGRLLQSKPKKKRRARPQRREEPIHIGIVNYLEATLPPHWIVHHSRNGGMSKGENGRAKAMGAKAGFHDILILGEKDIGTLTAFVVPWCWLMEVKDEDGVLSDKQKDLHKKVTRLGFPQCVVRSIDDARRAVVDWRLPSRDLAIPKEERPRCRPNTEASKLRSTTTKPPTLVQSRAPLWYRSSTTRAQDVVLCCPKSTLLLPSSTSSARNQVSA